MAHLGLSEISGVLTPRGNPVETGPTDSRLQVPGKSLTSPCWPPVAAIPSGPPWLLGVPPGPSHLVRVACTSHTRGSFWILHCPAWSVRAWVFSAHSIARLITSTAVAHCCNQDLPMLCRGLLSLLSVLGVGALGNTIATRSASLAFPPHSRHGLGQWPPNAYLYRAGHWGRAAFAQMTACGVSCAHPAWTHSLPPCACSRRCLSPPFGLSRVGGQPAALCACSRRCLVPPFGLAPPPGGPTLSVVYGHIQTAGSDEPTARTRPRT